MTFHAAVNWDVTWVWLVWLVWSEHRGAGRVVPVVRPSAGLRHRNVTLRCPGQRRCHIAVRLWSRRAPGSRGVRGVRFP